MFSEGHLLFIFISLVLIAGGNCRMSPGKKKNKARQYFIDLQRWRSLAALIACCDTFFSLLPQSFLL